MSIAVVVITHGNAASELLYSAKMIVGQHDNIGCIHFMTEDNGDMLAAKIEKTLADLDCDAGVLFLVDLWGGTPFNTAGRLLATQENYQVVTGVNVPMLVNVLLEREKVTDVQHLATLASEAGSAGVKVLTLSKVLAKPLQTESAAEPSDKHMNLVLVRVDDRLVHGKVITTWLKVVQANRIVVVNDAAAGDPTRIELFQQTAPHGVQANVVSVAEMVAVFKNGQYADDRVVVLVTKPADVLTLLEQGLPIKNVNVGSIAAHVGTKQLSPAVAVDETDIAALRALAEKGVHLDLRSVPKDESQDVLSLLP